MLHNFDSHLAFHRVRLSTSSHFYPSPILFIFSHLIILLTPFLSSVLIPSCVGVSVCFVQVENCKTYYSTNPAFVSAASALEIHIIELFRDPVREEKDREGGVGGGRMSRGEGAQD